MDFEKKSYSLKIRKYTRTRYGKGLGVVKWKEFNINCEKNDDQFDHHRCGRPSGILQQSIVLLALQKNALPLPMYKISRQSNRK